MFCCYVYKWLIQPCLSFFWLLLVTHFVTWVTPIDDINGKSHKMELKSSRRLFNQSFKVKITPLVIYGLKGGHTHTHILWRYESDFKKPGAPACGRRTPGLKTPMKQELYIRKQKVAKELATNYFTCIHNLRDGGTHMVLVLIFC